MPYSLVLLVETHLMAINQTQWILRIMIEIPKFILSIFSGETPANHGLISVLLLAQK
jgi:hypothetical protein